MAKEVKNNDNKIKKIDFLKVVGSNPERKVTEIGQKEFGMSQSAVYNALNEFILNCIWSEDEGDFPKRVLNFYNKEVPNVDEQLNVTDIQMLHHFVDDYYEKHLPGGNLNKGKEAVHTDEVFVPAEITPNSPPPQQEYNQPQQTYTNKMSQPYFNQQEYQKRDLSTDAGYLRTLLEQGKYVHPSLIDRFVKQYDMNKEVFDRDPLALLGYMKHVFSASQGEEIWKIFQKGRGKFVPEGNGQFQQGQMDPMSMFMMMQMANGGMNPQMMPMFQQMMGQNNQGNGQMDMNQMMMMLMMSQMGQKSAKDQQKQDMNELFEKMIQAIMLKMVGGAAEDRKPWDMYGGGMGMMGGMMGPPQIQEVMDANGRVTQRNIVPNFGMPGMMGQQNQPDPVLMSVLNNTMNTNTQLLMKITDSGKPITDILLGMIPYFKDSGNSALQLSNMFKTMNEMVPGFFGGKQQDGQNIEIAKLKLDTDLALSAQNMELQKMQHTWRIDEMDRKANNDNAQNWMRMIEGLGGGFMDKVAPAVMEGLGKGGLVGGGSKGQTQQMDPMQAQMRMQREAMRRQQEMQERHEIKEQQREQQQAVEKTINQLNEEKQMTQQQAMFAIGQLQSAVAQRDQYIQNLSRQMQDIQNQPTQRYQQGGQQVINEQQLLRMGSGELQQMLREIDHSHNQESSMKSRIETILANRSIMDQSSMPPQPIEQQESSYEPTTETEDLSSNDTRDFEEKLPEG